MFWALAIFVLDPLGSGCLFDSLVALGRLKKFFLVLRCRPFFPVAIGFSWPSRSPYAGWLIFGVLFIPGLPLLRSLFASVSLFTHVLPRTFFFVSLILHVHFRVIASRAFLLFFLACLSWRGAFEPLLAFPSSEEVWPCRLGAGPSGPALHHTSP